MLLCIPICLMLGCKDGVPVDEIKDSRKEKTITRATIELAYQRAKAMRGVVTGPKKLGVFGASYLYPMLVRFGVVKYSQKYASAGLCNKRIQSFIVVNIIVTKFLLFQSICFILKKANTFSEGY